jgi:hypothetical protein
MARQSRRKPRLYGGSIPSGSSFNSFGVVAKRQRQSRRKLRLYVGSSPTNTSSYRFKFFKFNFFVSVSISKNYGAKPFKVLPFIF